MRSGKIGRIIDKMLNVMILNPCQVLEEIILCKQFNLLDFFVSGTFFSKLSNRHNKKGKNSTKFFPHREIKFETAKTKRKNILHIFRRETVILDSVVLPFMPS